MQTITTRYIGPRNVRGSRYQATASGGLSVTIGCEPALNDDENHRAALKFFCAKHGWRGRWINGPLPNGKGALIWTDATGQAGVVT